MSGFRTHMLIGAVGGLCAYKLVNYVDPAALVIPINAFDRVYQVPSAVIGLTCVIGSAFLALWPDIDEPRSWISHRAFHLMWLLGALLGLVFTVLMTESLLLSLAAAIVGAIGGLVGGGLILSILRMLTGGHRRLTHSLLVGIVLLILAGLLWFAGIVVGYRALGIIPFALAWGQGLHLVGDIVTPEGVPLFYPLQQRDTHIFPRSVAHFGELIVGVTALVVGIVALWL